MRAIASFAAGLALCVVGCGATPSAPVSPPTSPTGALSESPTPTPTLTEVSLTEAEEAYLAAIDGIVTAPDGSRTFNRYDLDAGYRACGEPRGEYDEEIGDTAPPTLDSLIEGGGEVEKHAIKHLCPEYLPVWRKAQTGFTDGRYEVGKDVKPGTYRTTGPASDCYWERSTSGGETIANDFVTNAPRGVRVTIRSGEGFTSEGCGNWVRT